MKTKWLTYVKLMNLYQTGLAVFSEYPNADRAKSSYKEKNKGSMFATSATNTAKDNPKNQRECVLKDDKHPVWNCGKFKKMNLEERGHWAKEMRLCSKCLSQRASEENLLRQTRRREWLRKIFSQVAISTMQELGTKATC